MSEISPLELNNTIVKLRKLVNQSKIRCIRKLVKQIELLKNKQGTDEQIEKNKRKIEKLTEEIKEMKKLKPDEISKFALINTKSFEDLIKVVPLTANQLALYKLAFCPLLVKKIDEFREKFPLWPVEVPFILQRLGLQYKSRSKRQKSKNLVQILGQNVKNPDDSDENNAEKVENNDQNSSETLKNDEKTQKLKKKMVRKNKNDKIATTNGPENQNSSISPENSSNFSQNSSNLPQILGQNVKKSNDLVENKAEKIEKSDQNSLKSSKNDEKSQKLKKKVVKKSKNDKILTKNEPENHNSAILPENSSNITQNSLNLPQISSNSPKKVDEIRLKEGRTGQMELKRLKLSEISSEEIFLPSNFDDKTVKNTQNSLENLKNGPKIEKSNFKPLNNDPFFDQGDSDEGSESTKFLEDDNLNQDFLENDPKSGPKNENSSRKTLKNRFSSSLKRGTDLIAEKSEAKNRKISIRPLPKKIKDNPNLVPLGKPKYEGQKMPKTAENRKQRRQKMRQEAEKTAELATLHPSWLAKRKLNNPILLPAAGKKIKFDDS